jgi:predicted amidophosphoribosyltransferase
MAVAGAICPLIASSHLVILGDFVLVLHSRRAGCPKIPRRMSLSSPHSPCADSLGGMTTLGVVSRLLRATAELALPTACGGCGAPGATWCARCAEETSRVAFGGGPRQVCPVPCPAGHPPTWAASPYDLSVRAALVAYKDGDRRDLEMVLSPMLSDAMAAALAADPRLRAVLASGNEPVFVVPVPSSPAAVRRRGDAPLELLARAAVAQSGHPERELLVSPALRLRRRVADQAGLNHLERATNLEHAMQVQPRWRTSVRGVSCLLVDDVLTTGATLVEAARALREAGAGYVAAAAVAATRRRSRSA